jgi:hypothetical protein
MLGRFWKDIFRLRLGLLAAGVCLCLVALMAPHLWPYREAAFRVDLHRDDTCVGCHARLHPMMVQEWKQSAHFVTGVPCEGCHGTDHAAMMGEDGEVSAAMCAASCHSREYEQFKKSKHSRPKTGLKADLLKLHPDEVGGCTFTVGCHAVRKTYLDGSSGKCSVCHPSHGFSMEATRDPAICVTCHSGTNNTEVEEYEKSIHGILYRTVGLEGGGATCVTCHMPEGNHEDGFNTTDVVLNPGDGPLHFVHTMQREEFEPKRKAMVDLCKHCHGTKLARKALQEADDFRKKGAYMLEEAAAIVQMLYTQGLLDPMPHGRTPNPFAGPVLFLGPNQLFDREMSAAERIFYRMYMFTYSAAWRRAYHNLPALSRWHENEMLKNDLIMLRAEASRLCALARAGGLKPNPPPTGSEGGGSGERGPDKKVKDPSHTHRSLIRPPPGFCFKCLLPNQLDMHTKPSRMGQGFQCPELVLGNWSCHNQRFFPNNSLQHRQHIRHQRSPRIIDRHLYCFQRLHLE